MKKDSKQRLFEVMGRLDKTFKPKLNEEIQTPQTEGIENYDNNMNEAILSRDDMMNALQQKFKLRHIDTSENFDGAEGGIWLSGENGEIASDGLELFDYYSENHNNYTFGVHNKFQDFCEKNGWYPEWHDAGTLMIWED